MSDVTEKPKNSTPRLKSLDLQGYKTFASKHSFAFAPTVTAVVGPNGSGKSNIADAIRWVLGEQSFSLLRGKRTEDMIFSGSESRAKASMASAMITFDNADGWLPIDFSEVTIARRAYRDGQNEYLLNGQKVRLRDVNELLSRTGLSQRTYTIIGQGLVDAALSLRADERRRLFEEAAGIGLYRSRREEALRRLETTKRNLERVQDILTELRPRLRSLERQMKRSMDYEQVKSDLNEVLRTWYGYHWFQLLGEVTHANQAVHSETINRDDLRRRQVDQEKILAEARARIAELRSQLHVWSEQITSLYGERERAGKSLAVSEERLRWIKEQGTLLEAELELVESELSVLAGEIQSAQAALKDEKARYEEIKSHRTKLIESGELSSDQILEFKKAVEEARHESNQVASREIKWQIEMDHLKQEVDDLRANRAQVRERYAQLEGEFDAKKDEIREAEARVNEAQHEYAAGKQSIAEAEENLAGLEKNRKSTTSRLEDLGAQISSTQARLEILLASEGRTDEMVQRLLDANNEGHLRGLQGSLFEHLDIPSNLMPAIRAALGEFITGMAFDSWDDVLRAMEWSDGSGRAALLPLEPIQSIERVKPPKDKGCLGNAAELIRAEEGYDDIVSSLLGRTIVARDRAAAERLLRQVPADARIVSLKGDIYYPGGSVIVGQMVDESRREELIAEARSRVEELVAARSRVEADLAGISSALGNAQSTREEAAERVEAARESLRSAQLEFSRLQIELEGSQGRKLALEGELRESEDEESKRRSELELLEAAGRDLGLEREKAAKVLESALGELERAEPSVEMARVEARLEVAHRAIADTERRLESLHHRLIQYEREVEEKQTRLESSREEGSELTTQIETWKNEVDSIEEELNQLLSQARPAEEELAKAESRRTGLEEEVARLRIDLQKVERTYAQAQIDLTRKREEQTSLRRRIEDDFGLVAFEYDETTVGQEPLPFEGLVEKLPRVSEVSEGTERQMNRLRLQLRRMGPVNPEARREYSEVKKRTEFLTSQVDDLRKAESQIQEVIAELDLLMEREFRKTYEAVAVEFRSAFSRLFGGGSARLTLTDPDDMTTTGIDIDARLPGRRTQSLAMLSGGERSLTASALIFALLKVSPTPFCVLDEVDAMLDEANIVRFSEMLSELSEETQFILITHNRLTVQAAEIVYGISMGSDSASKVISLKLDEFKTEVPVK